MCFNAAVTVTAGTFRSSRTNNYVNKCFLRERGFPDSDTSLLICIAPYCVIVILIVTTPLSPFTPPWHLSFAAASVGGETKFKEK